jgi:transposase
VNHIEELRRQGLSVCGIAAVTGFDRKTVRRYLANLDQQPRYGPRQKRPSQLDPFKPYIDERLATGVWNATILVRELREQGYAGGYSTVKEYRQPKREASRSSSRAKV